MKKIVIILVLCVYSATTIGATIHLHYCMDKFVGWTLWHDEKDNECGKCGMKEKKGGCCKDEHKHIQLKTDHQKSSVEDYLHQITAPAIITPLVTFVFGPVGLSYYIPAPNAPPHIPKDPLYILNCVFLV